MRFDSGIDFYGETLRSDEDERHSFKMYPFYDYSKLLAV